MVNIAESTFHDNTGVEGVSVICSLGGSRHFLLQCASIFYYADCAVLPVQGGAVNVDVTAELTLLRNTFFNNLSTGYGPAVYDSYTSGVLEEGNTACGNSVIIDSDPQLLNGNVQCNGLYTVSIQNQLRQCHPFLQTECAESTNSPSIAPNPLTSLRPSGAESKMEPAGTNAPSSESNDTTVAPIIQLSSSPSSYASGAPTLIPTTPNESIIPSATPSGLRSLVPSDSPSLTMPSIEPTRTGEPSSQSNTTEAPSIEPSSSKSSYPSDAPILIPTPKESISPSTTPSDPPSLILTNVPSLRPSDKHATSPSPTTVSVLHGLFGHLFLRKHPRQQ
jgi:hypothetical protein